MDSFQRDIPMLWPSGPLAVAKRQKADGFTPEVRQVLERWHQPSSLDLLKNSPVTCLVLPWAAGLPQDAEQWRSSAPLVQSARQRGLRVVGWVEEEAGDLKAAVAAAQSAGLTAVAVPGALTSFQFPVIPYAERSHAPWDLKAPVLPVVGNVWPGVQGQQGGGSSAGPTGKPWVESNAWFVLLAQSRTPAPVWLMFDPPQGTVIRPQSYVVAVMDSEAYGGRWVISLDENLRKGLVERNGAAVQTLDGLSAALRFYAGHRDWNAFRSLAVVGVLSNFSGENFEMAGEVLKLAARRDLLAQPIWASQASPQRLAKFKAVVRYDPEPPSAALRKTLLDFVSGGGLLITGPKWGSEGQPSIGRTHPRYELRSFGKGRLAIAREDVADPYEAAMDVQSLVSRANDLVRLFNASTSGGLFYTGSPDGKRALLQIVNYTAGAGRVGGISAQNVTVWVRRRYQSARLLTMTSSDAQRLESVPGDGGYEYHIPTLPSFAAIEFEA